MPRLQSLRFAHTRAHRRLLTQTGEMVRGMYLGLGSYRDSDIPPFLRKIKPIVEGGKREAAKLRIAYYGEIAKALGLPSDPEMLLAEELLEQSLRSGPVFEEVYRRPFVNTRNDLSKGKSFVESILSGGQRASKSVQTDLQLASRQAGLQVRQGNVNIVGYRRVLSGARNCALCVIASTQRYTVNDLMPIHPGCKCAEEPIFGSVDPGQIIDKQLLEETHLFIANELEIESDRDARDAGLSKIINSPSEGQKLADYTDLIVTREHGEYGPTLSFRDQQFTRSAQVTPEQFDYRTLTTQQLDVFESEQAGKYQPSLEELNSLADYKGNEAFLINDALRDGRYADDWGPQITAIDEIIEQAPPTDRDLVVGRYLKGDSFIADLSPGQSFEDKAFMSTSVNLEEINKQGSGANNARMDIFVPEGSQGVFVDAVLGDLSEIPEEREFLLPRNTKLELVEKTSETVSVGNAEREITVYNFRLISND